MFRLSGLNAALMLSAAAVAACAQAPPKAAQSAATTVPSQPSCDDEHRLTASYLPQGWATSFEAGPGGGGVDAAAVGHWSGGSGRYVQVTRGREFELAEPQQSLTVLGEDARGGAVHEGTGVDFRLCETGYQLQGYGIDQGELYRLAESLAVRR